MPTATTRSGQEVSTESTTPVMLTPQEVSKRLKMPPGTLQQWRSQRRGPKWFKLENGHVRYWEHDYDKWLAEQIEKSYVGNE